MKPTFAVRPMRRPAFYRTLASAACGAWGVCASTAWAQPAPDFRECFGVATDADRLACYDKLAGRNAMVALPPSPAVRPEEAEAARAASGAAPVEQANPSTPAAQSALNPPATLPAAAKPSDSWLSRYWELDAADKRGTFNYTAYRPNLFMPVHYMRRVNQRPYSPTQGYTENLPDYQNGEAKIQISLRSKVAQDLLLPGADLWIGYTQESMWQLYNHAESAPFRNTDYQPEVMYVVPTPQSWQKLPLGWSWKMWQLGFVHQSNGQTDPESRSWNRLYGALGVERGDLSLQWRAEVRTDEKGRSSDNNPDITNYLRYSQMYFSWSPGRSQASLLWRPSFHGKGQVRLDWSYPVFKDRPDGLRWYAQFFQGYGETLLDYNFKQTSLSLGLTIFKF